MAKRKRKKRLKGFRRIRGRVVPIFDREQEAIEGAGLLSASTAGSALLGFAAGRRKKAGQRSRQLAFQFGRGQAGMSGMEGLIPGARSFKKSTSRFKQSRALKFGSKFALAGFAGLGVEKLIKAAPGVDNDLRKNLGLEVGAGIAGVGVATGLEAGFKKGFSGEGFRSQAARGLRSEKFRRNATRIGKAAISKLFLRKFKLKP